MGFMNGKRVLIVGVASKLSIAYGIAAAMSREGAELAFTYQNEKLKKRVEEFAASFGSTLVFPCDVAQDSEIETLFSQLSEHWDSLDSLTKAAKPLLTKAQGNVLTLTYQGSERVLPSYNVMGLAKASLEANVRYLASSMGPLGVRVNAISAGPIRTLAASGIKNFRKMLAYNESATPLRRNVTIEEVGNAAAFLCSDLASGISGEIMYVDGGFNTTAMPPFVE